MDIKIDGEKQKFKFRVNGILKYKEKYLVVKMNNNKFYCLPGGHVEFGEDTNVATIREMREEIGIETKIDRLAAICQNFFTGSDGKSFHEIGFYYVVSAVDESKINPNDYIVEELDKGKIQHLEFKWVTATELRKMDFRPTFIIDSLNKLSVDVVIIKD